MTDHPITPPPALIKQWTTENACLGSGELALHVATQAAQWGADTELEACRLWVSENCDIYSAVELIQFRRPKPPSLKELALQALYRFDDTEGHDGLTQEQIAEDFAAIRQALEALPD